MDLINTSLRKQILKGEECIGFIVFKGSYFWIIDWEAHFNLDQKKNFDAALKKHKGNSRLLTEYESASKTFRNGILSLTPDLLPKYLESSSTKLMSTNTLSDEFFLEDDLKFIELGIQVENSLSFNEQMKASVDAFRQELSFKLPKFYINYDRKIFMHMVKGRSYEAVVLDGWWGAECDFEHMIPISHRYWVRSEKEDYWAITNFS